MNLKKEIPLKDYLGDPRKGILFHQRDLQSKKYLVADCNYKTKRLKIPDILNPKKKKIVTNSKKVCPISHPIYEYFRALSTINSLKIKVYDKDIKQDDKKLLKTEFPENLKKEVLHKLLSQKECSVSALPKIESNREYVGFSDVKTEKNKNPKIKGCPTISLLIRLKYKSTELFLAALNDEKSLAEMEQLWHHIYFSGRDTKKLKDKLLENGIPRTIIDENIGKNPPIENGYGKYSRNVILKLIPFLEKGLIVNHAIFLANLKDVFFSKRRKGEIQSLKCFDAKERNEEIKKIDIAINQSWSPLFKEILEDEKLFSLIKNNETNRKIEEVRNTFLDENLSYSDKKITRKVPKAWGQKEWDLLSEQKQKIIIEKVLFEYNNYSGNYDIVKTVLQKDLSKTLQKRVQEYLQERYSGFDFDFQQMWHPSMLERFIPYNLSKELKKKKEGKIPKVLLPEIDFYSLKNPVVKQALLALKNKIELILNADNFGCPNEIHIEVARELNDTAKRIAYQNYQKKQQEKRENAKNQLQELFRSENYNDRNIENEQIDKYLLWEEQKLTGIHICIYSTETVRLSDIFGPMPKFQVEHTIPRSKYIYNSLENKTLCLAEYNTFKNNRLPSQLPPGEYKGILERIEPWKLNLAKLKEELDAIKSEIDKSQPDSNKRLNSFSL